MTDNGDQIKKAFGKDNASLKKFNEAMKKLNQAFCDAMMDGVDFTLGIEFHGNNGKLIHCRNKKDEFDRPKESERPLEMREYRKKRKFSKHS